MTEFLKAAFPWIIIGIAIAVFAVYHGKTKKKTNVEQDGAQAEPPENGGEQDQANSDKADRGKTNEPDSHLTDGMCIGMCVGVVFGTTGVCDLATGISLGMLLGMCVGMCIKK